MQLTAFQYNTNEVRVVIDEKTNTPYWVAKDVCSILGIEKYRDAIARLDDDEGCPVKVDTLGGTQTMTAVNESGLYTLILRSNKPEAKPFKRWITHDVIPSIRKTGKYDLNDQPKPSKPKRGFDVRDVHMIQLSVADRKITHSDQIMDINDPIFRDALFAAHNGQCFYTGVRLDKNYFHIDHIQPKASGGTDALYNLVPCDPRYNLQKSDHEDYAMIVSSQKKVIEFYAPYTAGIYNDRLMLTSMSHLAQDMVKNAAMFKILVDLLGERIMKKIAGGIFGIAPDELMELSSVAKFIKHEMLIGLKPSNTVSIHELYYAYKEWSVNNGLSPLYKGDFIEKLGKHLRIETKPYTDKKGYVKVAVGCSLMGGAL